MIHLHVFSAIFAEEDNFSDLLFGIGNRWTQEVIIVKCIQLPYVGNAIFEDIFL